MGLDAQTVIPANAGVETEASRLEAGIRLRARCTLGISAPIGIAVTPITLRSQLTDRGATPDKFDSGAQKVGLIAASLLRYNPLSPSAKGPSRRTG